jgi:hypothetical protein
MKRLLSFVFSILLGGILLYLALRGVPMAELGEALAGARYVWLAPLIVVVVASHAIRAYRWKLLLEAVPDPATRQPAGAVSFFAAFLSVLIGYFVNLATPRLGEIVRSANLARQEKKRISGVMGTVVVERLFDSLVLLLAIAAMLAIYSGRLQGIGEGFTSPLLGLWQWTSRGGVFVLAAAGVGAVVTGVLAVRAARRSDRPWIRRLRSAAHSFRDGLYSLHRSPRRLSILVSTIAMWFGYVLMAYIPLRMLDLHTRFDLGLGDAFGIMVFGSLGIALPAPGGTGSYHYFTRLALVHVFGVEAGAAVVYAVLAHGVQLVLYLCLGVAALLAQGLSWRELRADTIESPRNS